jgi:hypothetical protein
LERVKPAVASARSEEITPETLIHRVGGSSVENLRLSPLDEKQIPPGISVLLGGTPQQAAAQMRQAFPSSRKWQQTAHTVGTATAATVRGAGFEVVRDPTSRFPNHALIIHPDGGAGFVEANLAVLASVFQETQGC